MAKVPDPWPAPSRFRFAALRDHWRVGGESISFVSHRIGTSLLVWLLIGIALALPSGLYLLQQNLSAMSAQWEGRPGFSVYFKNAAALKRVAELAERLERMPEIERVSIVTAENALEEFRGYVGVPDALDMLSENPLPASVRATVADGVSSDTLTRLAKLAADDPAVEEVVIEKTWLERLSAISSVVNRLGWMLAVLFGIGAVLVSSASVRLAIEARLDELKVLKLVGGTDAFIKRPFLYFGLLYGVGGGIVAAMLIAAVLVVLEAPLAALFGSYGDHLELSGFDPIFIVGLLAAGGLLGVSGAIIASNQRLRGLEIV
ncbi:MAG: permease-like cell division protein FtsX [Gammaproteobacteria bacterium]|nr:permease-like cell division protein FtsX [Gammaproteobacteria bacterium]